MSPEELAAIRERAANGFLGQQHIAENDAAALLAEVERLTGERDALKADAELDAEGVKRTLARLDKVRALHRKDWWTATMTAYCTECNQAGRRALWPCPTIRAIDGSDQ